MIPALVQLSESILCLSCFSPETTLNFQGSNQDQIHKGLLANFHLCMLTNQLYLHLMGFFHLLRPALVLVLPSIAIKLLCTIKLLLITLEDRLGFQVIDFLLFLILLF